MHQHDPTKTAPGRETSAVRDLASIVAAGSLLLVATLAIPFLGIGLTLLLSPFAEVVDVVLAVLLFMATAFAIFSYRRWREMRRAAEQRAAALRALEESRSRYKLLAENARDIVFRFRVRPTERFEYLSPAVESILGYPPEAFYADPGLHTRIIRQGAKQEEAPHHDEVDFSEPRVTLCIHRDGRRVWLEHHLTPVRDAAGAVVAIEGISRDVTERVKAEQRLEHRIRLEQAIVGISRRFIDGRSFEEAVHEMLADLGRVSRASRAHFYILEDDGTLMRRVDGWSAPGAAALDSGVMTFDTASFAWWLRELERDEAIIIPNTAELPESAAAELAWFEAQGTQSALAFPVRCDNRLAGFIGLHDVEAVDAWEPTDLRIMHIASAILGNVLEQERAEDARNHWQARLQDVLERMTDAFFALDTDWRFRYVNPQTERIVKATMGLSKGDLLGTVFWDIIPGMKDSEFERRYRRAMRSQEPQHFEAYLESLDIWLEVHAYPTTEGLNIFFRDVTERKEGENALRLQAAAMDASVDGLAIHSADHGYVYVNAAHARMHGYDRPEALIGATWTDFYGDDEAARFRAEVLPRLESQGRWRGEATGKRADGSTFPQEASFTRLESGYTICVVRDTTARVRMEEEREAERQAMARQERLAALGILVAGVAHEINNPLMYLKGNVELALMDIMDVAGALKRHDLAPEVDLVETTRGLRSAVEGADRIARITRSLKVVARQDVGEHVPVDLATVLGSVQDLLRVATPENVTLLFDVPDEGLVVSGCASELHQVVLNLARNALEALPEEGGHVRVRATADHERVHVIVEDDGPGMLPEVRSQIFTPFFTTKENGTGLGLSITLRLIHDHGGDVDVDTAPDVGTTVRVSLPQAS